MVEVVWAPVAPCNRESQGLPGLCNGTLQVHMHICNLLTRLGARGPRGLDTYVLRM